MSQTQWILNSHIVSIKWIFFLYEDIPTKDNRGLGGNQRSLYQLKYPESKPQELHYTQKMDYLLRPGSQTIFNSTIAL